MPIKTQYTYSDSEGCEIISEGPITKKHIDAVKEGASRLKRSLVKDETHRTKNNHMELS